MTAYKRDLLCGWLWLLPVAIIALIAMAVTR